MVVKVQSEDFDVGAELAALTTGNTAIGGMTSFVGLVRDLGGEDALKAMTLEHYPGMTEQQLEDMRSEAVSKHQLEDALVVHRVGIVHPGDDIVLVAAFSAHRKEALAACREMMETLKSTAPFWKKEKGSKGEKWIKSRDIDYLARDAWLGKG